MKGFRTVTVPYIQPCWKASDTNFSILLTSA